MRIVYNPIYLADSKLIFWIFIVLMIVIILLTLFFVIKELKKNENK